jgi:hypothetical protein
VPDAPSGQLGRRSGRPSAGKLLPASFCRQASAGKVTQLNTGWCLVTFWSVSFGHRPGTQQPRLFALNLRETARFRYTSGAKYQISQTDHDDLSHHGSRNLLAGGSPASGWGFSDEPVRQLLRPSLACRWPFGCPGHRSLEPRTAAARPGTVGMAGTASQQGAARRLAIPAGYHGCCHRPPVVQNVTYPITLPG